jgi:hypothetical protein
MLLKNLMEARNQKKEATPETEKKERLYAGV